MLSWVVREAPAEGRTHKWLHAGGMKRILPAFLSIWGRSRDILSEYHTGTIVEKRNDGGSGYMETSSSNRMTRTQRTCGLGTMSCHPSVNHKTARQAHTHRITHTHTPLHVCASLLFLKHYTLKNVSVHTSVGAGRGAVSGAVQDARSSVCVCVWGGARFICCCRKTLTPEL